MVTKLSYSLTRADDDYVAKCHELSVESTGASAEQATLALRRAVEQQLTSVEAVGPPSRPPPPPSIELVLVGQPECSPQGPGEAPSAANAR